MNNILIIGAGLSSGALIKYVLERADQYGWFITVADSNLEMAKQKVAGYDRGRAAWLDVMKSNDRRDLISRADLVVSLLPAHLHLEVATDCIRLNKHMVTASYVNKELYRLGDEARDRSLIFMGEMGLDPGLDHMSAMYHVNRIKEMGGKILSFKSYTGGLITKESANNPWNYKFTWNPRNVILAGQGTAQYMSGGKYKYIPYNRLFAQARPVEIKDVGMFESYANRDSLLYRDIYGLEDIPYILRGTLRYPGFCESWNALIEIGLTDGSYPILESENLTYYDLLEAYVRDRAEGLTLKERVATLLQVDVNSKVIKNLHWLGLFSRKKIGIKDATPAFILENLLRDKWKLDPSDKDMILMQHEFKYELDGKVKRLFSTLKMVGEDADNTAMSKLVGLPLAIFVKNIMLGKIRTTGVNIPVMKEVYGPVLAELKEMNIEFKDIEINA